MSPHGVTAQRINFATDYSARYKIAGSMGEGVADYAVGNDFGRYSLLIVINVSSHMYGLKTDLASISHLFHFHNSRQFNLSFDERTLPFNAVYKKTPFESHFEPFRTNSRHRTIVLDD